MWDLPGPGLEPMSPALAGRFLTTVSPGSPYLTASFIVTIFQFFPLDYLLRTYLFNKEVSVHTIYLQINWVN